MNYNYLIVGSGLYGATIGRHQKDHSVVSGQSEVVEGHYFR